MKKYSIVKINDKEFTNQQEINSLLYDKKLYWLLDSEIEEANIEIKRNKVIWKDGNWYNGIWKGAIWENGNFYYGQWNNGIFKNGTFHNGVFKDGIFENGELILAKIEGGVFKNINTEENNETQE